MEQRAQDTVIDDNGGEERFVSRAAAILNSSVEALPPHIEARLDGMRSAALGRVTDHDAFVQSAGLTLASGDSAEGLPVAVRARLDDIRAEALQRAARQLHSQPQRTVASLLAGLRARLLNPGLGIPAGAFASICVLLTTFAVFTARAPEEVLSVAMNEEGLVLASADDIELYENLEFYQWLAENGL